MDDSGNDNDKGRPNSSIEYSSESNIDAEMEIELLESSVVVENPTSSITMQSCKGIIVEEKDNNDHNCRMDSGNDIEMNDETTLDPDTIAQNTATTSYATTEESGQYYKESDCSKHVVQNHDEYIRELISSLKVLQIVSFVSAYITNRNEFCAASPFIMFLNSICFPLWK